MLTKIGEIEPAMNNIFFHVTKACNLACKYCYFSARKPMPDEMTAEEILPLWPEMLELRPRKIVFTGGEPLLKEDLFEMIEGLRESDVDHVVKRCLNTNGHLMTPAIAARLVGLVDEVRVSLDGLRTNNDSMRGAGNYDSVMEALDCLIEVGIRPKVLITVTSLTFPDLEELLLLLRAKGEIDININGFRPIGRGKGKYAWQIDGLNINEIVARTMEHSDIRISNENDDQSSGPINCGVGTMLNIMPNGDIFPCHVLTDPQFRLGNLRKECILHICNRYGLLGQLASLNFQELAQEDDALKDLVQPNVCMGNVFAKTESNETWRKHLPPLGKIRG